MSRTASIDLPSGFRWADDVETDRHLNISPIPGARLIERTVDASGYRYSSGTCDLAVPV